MDFSQVTQYIIEIAPAVTSLIGVVVALVVGIKKIKATGDSTIQEIKDQTKEISDANAALMKENLELKGELKKVLNDIHNVKGK